MLKHIITCKVIYALVTSAFNNYQNVNNETNHAHLFFFSVYINYLHTYWVSPAPPPTHRQLPPLTTPDLLLGTHVPQRHPELPVLSNLHSDHIYRTVHISIS